MATSPPLSLSFSDVVTTLMQACSLPPLARAAFDGRLRHLQRLGMLDRADGGPRNLRYGIREVAQLATAMRLIDASMPPALAARYVRERWDTFTPVVLAGAVGAVPSRYLARRSLPSTPFAVIRASALSLLGQRQQHDHRGDEPLGSVIALGEADATFAEAIAGAALVIDSRTYMPAVVRNWAERLLATETELMTELDRLRFGGE